MDPAAGGEDEFNDWYDTEHFPEHAGLIKGRPDAQKNRVSVRGRDVEAAVLEGFHRVG